MLVGVHAVLKYCVSGWEACIHLPHESIKPATSINPHLLTQHNMLVCSM